MFSTTAITFESPSVALFFGKIWSEGVGVEPPTEGGTFGFTSEPPLGNFSDFSLTRTLCLSQKPRPLFSAITQSWQRSPFFSWTLGDSYFRTPPGASPYFSTMPAPTSASVFSAHSAFSFLTPPPPLSPPPSLHPTT